MTQNNERLLSVKEIAIALGRTEDYIYRLRRLGLKMPGGRTTLSKVLAFLEENPTPWKNYRKNKKTT